MSQLTLRFECTGPFDVVLNSLTSPGMVAATLACVGLGGRLAEISKRDVWSPARVAQERPDLRYQLVAIDFLPVEVTPCLTRTRPWPPDAEPALEMLADPREMTLIPLLPCKQVLQRSFSHTSKLLARGQVASVQGLAYPFSNAVTALRHFAHARHIGKIGLHMPEPAAMPGGATGQAQVIICIVATPS